MEHIVDLIHMKVKLLLIVAIIFIAAIITATVYEYQSSKIIDQNKTKIVNLSLLELEKTLRKYNSTETIVPYLAIVSNDNLDHVQMPLTAYGLPVRIINEGDAVNMGSSPYFVFTRIDFVNSTFTKVDVVMNYYDAGSNPLEFDINFIKDFGWRVDNPVIPFD
jgi:hypothetical protein